MKTDRVNFVTEDGINIVGLLTRCEKSTGNCVLIIHGNASSKDRSSATDISTELTARGIDNLRIDLNGCGESEGLFEEQTITRTVHDTDAAIAFLLREGYKNISLYGASFGGCTALASALKHPEIIKLGCKSPVSDYPAIRLAKYGQAYIDDWQKTGFAVHQHIDGRKLNIKYSWWEDALNYVMRNKAHLITVPTLIAHGSMDNRVPLEQSKKMVEAMPNAKLIVVDGANHDGVINGSRSKCIKILGDWFEEK